MYFVGERNTITFLVNGYVCVVYTMFEILYIFGACISGYIGFVWCRPDHIIQTDDNCCDTGGGMLPHDGYCLPPVYLST